MIAPYSECEMQEDNIIQITSQAGHHLQSTRTMMAVASMVTA